MGGERRPGRTGELGLPAGKTLGNLEENLLPLKIRRLRGPAETNPNVPPPEPLLVTLTLVVKRATAEDYAALAVDGVDALACFG